MAMGNSPEAALQLIDFPHVHESDEKYDGSDQSDSDSDEKQNEDSSSTDEEDNLFENRLSIKLGHKDTGVQTSKNHFLRITSKRTFKKNALDRVFSTDFNLSPLYDDLHIKNPHDLQLDQTADCSTQVDERHIWQSYI